jgi:hypothetical protein
MPTHNITKPYPAVIVTCLLGMLMILLTSPHTWAQSATTPVATEPQPAPRKVPAVPIESEPTSKSADESAVVLSPFEVTTDTKGYYASNSMSGTRFNTKVEDLASSLTVVTKEQMSDFAMLDINDIFLYAASTEGSGTYTAYSVDRNGSVSDSVQSNPTQANRVRGIAPANVAYGNIETMGRMPIDPIIIDGVEISRGPNANVFGLGNPSGTVNQVPAAANLTRDKSQVSFRTDSYEGYRQSLDVNRVLIKNKLAVRFGEAFQHEGFVRKPSGVNTSRFNAMVKYKPFANTTISGSFLYYRMNGNRPNFLPPRDSISYWAASGKPTWDPITQQVHLNGATVGTYPTATGLPDYFTNTFTGSTHSIAFVDQNGLGYWSVPQVTLSTTPNSATNGIATPSAIAGSVYNTVRFMSPTPASGSAAGKITAQPLFSTTPTISDKSLYDWSDVNIASVNRAMDRTLLTNLQVDQFFFNTPRQMLVGQAGFMREDSQRYQRNLIGVSNDNGQSGQLLVDVNEKLLDGTPNPYFLRPYIGTDQPRTTWEPAKWDTYRVQLAYKLDLTQEPTWLKWLGVHQLSGYDEYKYRINRRYSYRDAMVDSKAWIPAGLSRGNQGGITGGAAAAPQLTRAYYRYYVGDNKGSNVDYAPSDFKYGTYNFLWGNGNTGFNNEPTGLGQVAVTDATGAASNTKTILKTMGGVIHSHFLDGKIVTTFGLREDKQYVKNGSAPQGLNPDGTTFNYASIDHWAGGDYKFNSGKTSTAGVVVRPLRDLALVNQWANQGSLLTGFLGDVLRGLSLTYNKADSFTPQDPRINLYFQPLPNPEGHGTDYGFGLNLFGGKLVARFNHYENEQINARGNDASTIAQRVTRIDITSTATFLLQTQALAWVTAQNPTWTLDQIHTEVGKQMGVPWETQVSINNAFNAGSIASTNDIQSKGNELELNYNPTKFWTVSGSVTESKSSTTNVSADISQWIGERMKIWTTITDPRGPDHILGTADDAPVLWWNQSYATGGQTPSQNYAAFVGTPFSVVKQLEGKSNPQIRRYNARVSTNYRLAGIMENRILRNFNVGGAVRWEGQGAIGYYGQQQLPAISTDLDASRPVYDKANAYFDAFIGYRTRLWANKISANFQLNVRNIQESGHLQPIGAFPDGTPHTYRIVDPRQFILQASFDL